MCNHTISAKSLKQINSYHRRRMRAIAKHKMTYGKYSDAATAFHGKERERERRLIKYIKHIDAKKEAARYAAKFSQSVDPR